MSDKERAHRNGKLVVIRAVEQIISRGCAQKKCEKCYFHKMDGCKDMYTIAQIEQYIENVREVEHVRAAGE